LSFVQRGRLAMSQSRSAADRRASTACGSMADEAKEAFVGDVRSMADADDLSGSDAERSKPQALAGLFPAFDRTSSAGAIASPVCEAVWFKERAASLRLARTRAFDLPCPRHRRGLTSRYSQRRERGPFSIWCRQPGAADQKSFAEDETSTPHLVISCLCRSGVRAQGPPWESLKGGAHA
jgi:hypothetical protein